MKFPAKPLFFDLNVLECRLLVPRIAFQKLMQAPRGKQLKINGNIVNVPADVANTVSMLPSLPSETSTIKVNLKRRLQYKSSAYLQRQLGSATLFYSFSSAETQSIHLLRILGKLVDSKEYTDNELENLNWEEKSRLIQSDPVTCARHFDYQINQFIQSFLLSPEAPLGKIADWFYRVEYQQRGSPHIHMLIWLENAPTFGEDFDGDVVSFIDKIITSQKANDNPDLLALVNRQVHRHSHPCWKKSKCLSV